MTVRLAAVVSGAACVALGGWAAKRLSAREKTLQAWDAALGRMEGALAYGGAALPQALCAGADNHFPVLEELIKRMEESPAMPLGELLSGLPWEPLLTSAEKDTAHQCLKALFSPSPVQQSQALALARAQWQEYLKAVRAAREKNSGLYISLGWLGGAALFIFLC